MFTSLFLGGPVPFKAGMKMMSDFEKNKLVSGFSRNGWHPFFRVLLGGKRQ